MDSLQNRHKILIVDDDDSHRIMLQTILAKDGYEVWEADDGRDAIRMVEHDSFDLILLDLRMKHTQGIEALQQFKKLRPNVPVLIMTAFASVETAIRGLKLGALDYLLKPLDMDLVRETIISLFSTTEKQDLVSGQLPDQDSKFDFSKIIGSSLEIQNLIEILRMVAPTDATVLIHGESGSGKELVADALQRNSYRAEAPFIKINCAAILDDLLQSELFGHEKGAFTGAITLHKGRFELADGGTIMLDEIGDMSLSTQAKMLRVIQEGEFERVGGSKSLKTDVRIIAATNKDLQEEVRQGRFREDLYFRLSIVPIEIPPLRVRSGDVPELANFFLDRYTKKNGRSISGFSREAMHALKNYNWPGNVRELENIVERAVILCRQDLLTTDVLPSTLFNAAETAEVKVPDTPTEDSDEAQTNHHGSGSLKDIEKEMILRALEETNNNITKTAKILGISRRGLQYKLKDLGIR